nr:MAG TPA_asm: YopX protein [Caudoviricetes sp.]
MRDIIFRSKRTDNGEWVYGVPTKDSHGETVMVESVYECEEYNCRGANCLYVDENTIGQYTDLTDKNGTKIFEGDVVTLTTDSQKTYRVVFEDGCFFFDNIRAWYTADSLNSRNIAVIGNIHDNPELLKEGNND